MGGRLLGESSESLEVAVDVDRAMVGNVESVLLEYYAVFLNVKSLVTEEEDVVDRGELRSLGCRTALIFSGRLVIYCVRMVSSGEVGVFGSANAGVKTAPFVSAAIGKRADTAVPVAHRNYGHVVLVLHIVNVGHHLVNVANACEIGFGTALPPEMSGDSAEFHTVALAAENCPGKALGLVVVKTLEKMPAVVDDVKHSLADEKGSVIGEAFCLLVGEKLILGGEKVDDARLVKIGGHFLKTENVGQIAHIDIAHMKIAVINRSAPDVVRHNSEFCFLAVIQDVPPDILSILIFF